DPYKARNRMRTRAIVMEQRVEYPQGNQSHLRSKSTRLMSMVTRLYLMPVVTLGLIFWC
ncbi:hypothetical protein BG011_004169, partial [Mortierella polycephala]